MKTAYIILLLVSCGLAEAQQQTYDLFTFSPPAKWKKAVRQNSIIYSTTNKQSGTWAQIDLLKSTASKGSVSDDFLTEWKELVMERYGVTGDPVGIDSLTFKGWKLYTGLGYLATNNDTASILLNTFSDGNRCASFILLSNTTSYGTVLDAFIASISLPEAKTQLPAKLVSDPAPLNDVSPVAVNDGYQFNITNFDDGWTSVVKEDWVEATKGSIKVLLHYPRAEDKEYYSQYDEHVNVFWNLLVAPRYTNLRQYQSPGYNHSFEPGLFAAGLLNEKATGKDVWVALFQKGKTGWIEVIAPDKASFVQMFGVDNPDTYFSEWEPLVRLSGMNRFAVGEKDLAGKWSSEFSNSSYYYGVYTGLYAGATSYSSRVNFTFRANKTFNWDLAMAQGATGTSMKVDNAKASGTWKMLNNWQVWFSEIERNPKTYNAYFSCVKGGRILWLQDVSYGSYTAYGKVTQ